MNAHDPIKRPPVVLVHGWNSHPGIWNKLSPRLVKEGVPVWRFDFSTLQRPTIPAVAQALDTYILSLREACGYTGDIDIVCHSLGTCAARYYLEVMDGQCGAGTVRKLVGLGAPNTGSALAELFFDPEKGPEIRKTLAGVFVPVGFDPAADPLVCDVRFESTVMQDLTGAGLRTDIEYHEIVTKNDGQDPAFFPWFHGKTWERDDSGAFHASFCGDGIVSNKESALPGITPDLIPSTGPGALPPVQYCHIHMPRNTVVMDHVLRTLHHP